MQLFKMSLRKTIILLLSMIMTWYGVIHLLNSHHQGYLGYNLYHGERSFRAMHLGVQNYFYRHLLSDSMTLADHPIKKSNIYWHRELSRLQILFYYQQFKQTLRVMSRYSQISPLLLTRLESALKSYDAVFIHPSGYDHIYMVKLTQVRDYVYQELMHLEHDDRAVRNYQVWLRLSESIMMLSGLILCIILMNYFIIQPMLDNWRKKVTFISY